MGISGGVAIATESSVVSFSKLNDRLVVVGSFENDDRIAWNEAPRVVEFVVRTVEAKNCLTVEGSSLEGGAFPCRRSGGMSVVTRLVVPLTDGVGGVYHRGGIGRVKPKLGREFRGCPTVCRSQARGKTKDGGEKD